MRLIHRGCECHHGPFEIQELRQMLPPLGDMPEVEPIYAHSNSQMQAQRCISLLDGRLQHSAKIWDLPVQPLLERMLFSGNERHEVTLRRFHEVFVELRLQIRSLTSRIEQLPRELADHPKHPVAWFGRIAIPLQQALIRERFQC